MRFGLDPFIVAFVGEFVCAVSALADAPAMMAPRAAEPFPAKDVRLLDGPFRDAMLRDQKFAAHPGESVSGLSGLCVLRAN